MNDYFGKLAARTLGQAPRILPRPVSGFEPVSPGVEFREEPGLDAGSPDRGASPERQQETIPESRPIPGTVSSRTESRPPSNVAAPEPLRMEAVLEEEVGAMPDSVDPEFTAWPARADHGGRSETRPAGVKRQLFRQGIPLVTGPLPASKSEHQSEAVDVESGERVGSSRIETFAPQSIKSPDGMPIIERQPESAREEKPTEKTIRVTIGRLEVRAVTPPLPVAPARRAVKAPSVSLEEYLKGGPESRR